MASELFMLTVFFFLQCAIAQERIVTTGRRVYIKCDINSTQTVTWSVQGRGSSFLDIYTCQDNNSSGQCTKNLDIVSLYESLQVNRSNEVSVLSLIPIQKEQAFQCKLENGVVKTFTISLINSTNIVKYCNVSLQSISKSDDPQVTLSCGFTFKETIDANFTLKGFGQNNFVIRRSSHGINGTIPFQHFDNIHDAYCEMYFPDIDETRSCTYPNISKNQYNSEGNEIVIECEAQYDVDWYLMDLYGRKEGIENRSWIREGGRSLLIRDISERDVGKVVVCRNTGDDSQANKGTIGFTIISENMSGDNSNSEDLAPTPKPNAHDPYLVLMLLFLSLWLITIGVGGVWLVCTPKGDESGTFAIALASGNASVPNGGSGERETPLVNVRTGSRGDPVTLNTNNSAHNPAFEPEVDSRPTHENNQNRQSNNESHLYFTLEKSSPSPVNSLPRASAARWEHPDANPASLNHPQSSHSQCYETVGEPNKGATCSYDLGEYAEVGYQIQGKGPPDLGEYAEVGYQIKGKGPPDLSGRPSIRKKPGREKVKENDISSLYSKVNK